MYDPPNLVLPVGTTVTWVNNDPVNNHRVYSEGSFDSQVLSPGQSWSFTFGEVREYNVRDFIYPKIRSSIRVE